MTDLLQQIRPHMPKSDYFKLLMLNSEAILNHIGLHGKIETGKALGMSPQAFATFFPCLLAHLSIQEDQHAA